MAEYIDIKMVQKVIRYKEDCVECTGEDCRECLAEFIGFLKPADVAPIKHGKWNKVYSNKVATVYECSNCGHITLGASEYCICGARMDGE